MSSPPSGKTSRILLIRHGRSAHRPESQWCLPHHVRDFERGYNDAGILEHDTPPPTLIEIAKHADVLVASDLLRAIESARRLAPDREPVILPSLREIELEPPRWLAIPLPMIAWEFFCFAQWSYRLARGADHALVQRAQSATDWLLDRAADSKSVVAVTHGAFRRIIRNRLEARGWTSEDSRMGHANWSAWSFSPTAGRDRDN